MILLRQPQFLGDLRRRLIIKMLEAPSLEWARSDELGRTGSGLAWQLADRAQHEMGEMTTLSRFLAAAVHTELRHTLPESPAAAGALVPQVFPVRMLGSRHDPPHQDAHRDHLDGETPTVTCIYYAEVLHAEGGDLLLFDEHGRPTDRVEPASDLLVVMDGTTVHAVEKLVAGRRTSVVVNFYRVA